MVVDFLSNMSFSLSYFFFFALEFCLKLIHWCDFSVVFNIWHFIASRSLPCPHRLEYPFSTLRSKKALYSFLELNFNHCWNAFWPPGRFLCRLSIPKVELILFPCACFSSFCHSPPFVLCITQGKSSTLWGINYLITAATDAATINLHCYREIRTLSPEQKGLQCQRN